MYILRWGRLVGSGAGGVGSRRESQLIVYRYTYIYRQVCNQNQETACNESFSCFHHTAEAVEFLVAKALNLYIYNC